MEMTARYRSTCAKTGEQIQPGDRIDYDRNTKRAVLLSRGTAPVRVSDEIVIGDRAFYRNRNGRCEDAPCCGCCTI